MKQKKVSEEEKEKAKRSLTALGYFYEVSETGERKRRRFFYARIIFVLLLITFFYFLGYTLYSLTNGTSLSNPTTLVSAAALGFIVGAIIGMTSVGAGVLMTPILLLDFGSVVGKTLIIGTATTTGTVEKVIVSARNYFKKRINAGYVFMIAITGVPLASIGAFYSSALVSWNLFNPLLSAVLFASAVVIIIQHRLERMNVEEPAITRSLRIKGLVIGVVVGLIAGLTGASTGTLLVASLILLLKFPNRTAVDIALVEGGLILLAATLTQLYLGHVNLPFTGVLLVGGIPGILLGNHYKYKVNQKLLGYGIAGVILLESLRTIAQFFTGKSFFIF